MIKPKLFSIDLFEALIQAGARYPRYLVMPVLSFACAAVLIQVPQAQTFFRRYMGEHVNRYTGRRASARLPLTTFMYIANYSIALYGAEKLEPTHETDGEKVAAIVRRSQSMAAGNIFVNRFMRAIGSAGVRQISEEDWTELSEFVAETSFTFFDEADEHLSAFRLALPSDDKLLSLSPQIGIPFTSTLVASLLHKRLTEAGNVEPLTVLENLAAIHNKIAFTLAVLKHMAKSQTVSDVIIDTLKALQERNQLDFDPAAVEDFFTLEEILDTASYTSNPIDRARLCRWLVRLREAFSKPENPADDKLALKLAFAILLIYGHESDLGENMLPHFEEANVPLTPAILVRMLCLP